MDCADSEAYPEAYRAAHPEAHIERLDNPRGIPSARGSDGWLPTLSTWSPGLPAASKRGTPWRAEAHPMSCTSANSGSTNDMRPSGGQINVESAPLVLAQQLSWLALQRTTGASPTSDPAPDAGSQGRRETLHRGRKSGPWPRAWHDRPPPPDHGHVRNGGRGQHLSAERGLGSGGRRHRKPLHASLLKMQRFWLVRGLGGIGGSPTATPAGSRVGSSALHGNLQRRTLRRSALHKTVVGELFNRKNTPSCTPLCDQPLPRPRRIDGASGKTDAMDGKISLGGERWRVQHTTCHRRENCPPLN